MQNIERYMAVQQFEQQYKSQGTEDVENALVRG
jgi:hypothetical protein